MFGVGRNDQLLIGKRRADWYTLIEADILENAQYINKLEEEFGLNY